MVEISYIKNQKQKVLEGLSKRNFQNAKQVIEKILSLDEKRKSLQSDLDNTLAVSNKLAKEIGIFFKNGETQKANLLREKTNILKGKSKKLNNALQETVERLKDVLYTLPNIPDETVPFGNTEQDNEIVFQSDNIPKLHESALPHWELAKKHNLIDFELGNKVSAAGFPFYIDKGARLQRALVDYFLNKNIVAGYIEVQPPLMVNEASGIGTGQFPDKEGQMYHDAKDDLYLIPTSEVPITNMYREVLLKEADFPIAHTAFTPCFRRESGSYGAHVRGLNRLHQFDKVEIVRIEHPKNSYKALKGMVTHVQNILEELNLPFRIVKLCGGDLGFTSALTYDFEVYSTVQQKWLEVSSVSNFESFQSNRLKLRFKNEQGKSQLAHTLNGSSLALPRVLAALLENYQTENNINIPKILVPYTGFDKI